MAYTPAAEYHDSRIGFEPEEVFPEAAEAAHGAVIVDNIDDFHLRVWFACLLCYNTTSQPIIAQTKKKMRQARITHGSVGPRFGCVMFMMSKSSEPGG
jgi:hypothetical protein